MAGPDGEELWESYVENNTAAALRVFWYYGPDEKQGVEPDVTDVRIITVVAITAQP